MESKVKSKSNNDTSPAPPFSASKSGGGEAHQFPPSGFARLLMNLLNEEEAPDAMWWLPDGKSGFAINPKTLPKQILDLHFRGTKFTSFVRRLHNAYV